MNDKALLNEFSNTLVATIYNDRVELNTTVDDRLGGSGFYPDVINGKYYMVDIYNDESDYLGDNLVDALKDLNVYNDYFNYYPNDGNFIEGNDDGEYWTTDFEYSLRSTNEFESVVIDMQSDLKEGNWSGC